jgi:quinoprotein dehydrogenase-associated probable ABC transporter substrate-binding protein
MSSRFPERGVRIVVRDVLLVIAACGAFGAGPQAAPLRVCADPDNLPYSHRQETGFENRIAQVLAEELGRPLQYYWQPHQRGFVRKTMGTGHCDLFVGVPSDFDRVLTTRPYYRSSYVFVNRADNPLPLLSFDDPRLAQLRVGVQLVGDDLAATPAGHALVQAGAIEKVTGFPVLGEGTAAARMLRALAQGQLDAVLVWGPQAGWLASHAAIPLAMKIAQAPPGLAAPFEFSIAMGVRRGDGSLRDALDAAIERRRPQIDEILREYSVPRTDREGKS